MTNPMKAVWFDLSALIDPNITGGRIKSYGAPDQHKGHTALEDNGWRTQVTLYALQGLVNRKGPRLMFDTQFWNWKPADQTWRDLYAERKGIEFETISTLDALIDRFREDFAGLAIVDPAIEQTLYVATTLAGLDNLLPVLPELADRIRARHPEIPVVHDFRGRWQEEFAPLDYAIEELMPRCDPGMIYSVDNLWTGMSIHTLDLAVMRRAFIFRCTTRQENAEAQGRIWKIHTLAGPNCAVYGWGEPEDRYCEMASMNSNYIMCTEAPNLSFHSRVPADTAKFVQKSRVDESTFRFEENKVYVAFMTTEGDALKIHMSFQGGAWRDERRGQVAINWGFQPRMLDAAPAMAEYFYETMSDKDHFFCGCSGAGYTYPNWMPEPEAFFRETDTYMQRADLEAMDCWIHFSRPVYETYAKLSPHTKTFILPCGPVGVKMTEAGTPVILRYGSLHYYPNNNTNEQLTEAIRSAADALESLPAFLTVFVVPDAEGNTSAQGGFCPGDFATIASALGDERFKVVTLQEMGWAAREYARRYPERVNKSLVKHQQRRVGVNVLKDA